MASTVLKACVIGLLCLLTLLAVEWVCSFFVTPPSQYIDSDSRLNHTWHPGGHVTMDAWSKDNPAYPKPYEYIFNKQGWLETYDITVEKPQNVYRIFYVGDSFTAGCLEMSKSVPSLVENALNERSLPQDLRIEVVNAGTTSYSPLIYYVLVRYYITEYKPDLIVVNVDMTDNYDDVKYSETLLRDAHGDPWGVPPRNIYKSQTIETESGLVTATLLMKIFLFADQHSSLFNLARKLRTQYRSAHGTLPEPAADPVNNAQGAKDRWAWCENSWTPETEEHVNLTVDTIGRLLDYCRAHHIKVLLTAVPHYKQFVREGNGYVWSHRPFDELKKITEAKGGIYLDSFAALDGQIRNSPQPEYYYKGDMHFNPKGNAIWAKAHIDALLNPQNHLLPESLLKPGP